MHMKVIGVINYVLIDKTCGSKGHKGVTFATTTSPSTQKKCREVKGPKVY